MTNSEGFFLFDSRFLWPFATPAKVDWQQSDGLGERLLKTCSPREGVSGHAAPRYWQGPSCRPALFCRFYRSINWSNVSNERWFLPAGKVKRGHIDRSGCRG